MTSVSVVQSGGKAAEDGIERNGMQIKDIKVQNKHDKG